MDNLSPPCQKVFSALKPVIWSRCGVRKMFMRGELGQYQWKEHSGEYNKNLFLSFLLVTLNMYTTL